MMKARIEIYQDKVDEALYIRDVGPWGEHPTVTNDVENVVRHLIAKGLITNGRRLFCFDSDYIACEIVHDDGEFVEFITGRRDKR